ncbi:MAG: glycerophosphodiester phosphodiesterase, partial [Anaerolineae bacterium]
DRWNISQKRFMAPFVEAFVLLLKLLMPLRVRLLAEEADVAALYYKVLSPPVVEIAHSRGVEVYAWTVNDRPTLQRMVAMGVDGLVSDRPDLFVDSRQ